MMTKDDYDLIDLWAVSCEEYYSDDMEYNIEAEVENNAGAHDK